jgi:hypothetical protein
MPAIAPSRLRRRLAPFLAIPVVIGWIVAIVHANGSGFFEDQFAVELMLVSGATIMMLGALLELWGR